MSYSKPDAAHTFCKIIFRKQKHQLEKEKKLYLANQEKLENSDKVNLAKIEKLQMQINELLAVKVSNLN